jgi:hypothetical protein
VADCICRVHRAAGTRCDKPLRSAQFRIMGTLLYRKGHGSEISLDEAMTCWIAANGAPWCSSRLNAQNPGGFCTAAGLLRPAAGLKKLPGPWTM